MIDKKQSAHCAQPGGEEGKGLTTLLVCVLDMTLRAPVESDKLSK